MNTQPNLGNIITNDVARKVIYGVYALAVIAVTAVQQYLSALQNPFPDWVIGALAVLAYLGAPVSALALANAPKKTAFAPEVDTAPTSLTTQAD